MYIRAQWSVPSWHEFSCINRDLALATNHEHYFPLPHYCGICCLHVTHRFYKIRSFTCVALTFVLGVLDRPMRSSWTSIRPFPNYMNRFHTWWLISLPPHSSIQWPWISTWKTCFAQKDASITVRTFRTTKFPISLPPHINLFPGTDFESYVRNRHYKCCLVSLLIQHVS